MIAWPALFWCASCFPTTSEVARRRSQECFEPCASTTASSAWWTRSTARGVCVSRGSASCSWHLPEEACQRQGHDPFESGGVECGLLGGRLHEPLWNSVLFIWNAPSARDTSLYRRRRKYRWRLVVKNAYAVHVHSETSNTILSLVCAYQSNPHPIIVIVLHLHTNDLISNNQ